MRLSPLATVWLAFVFTAVAVFGRNHDPAPLAASAAADPPTVTVVPRPAAPKWQEVRGSGRLVTLAVSKPSRWDLAEEAGAELVPSPDGRSATLITDGKAGTRVKVFVTALDAPGDPARIVVVLGDGPDPPPVSDLTQKYKDAIAADGPTAKADAAKLATVYYEVADRLDQENDTLLTRLKTQADLLNYAASRSAANAVPPLPALQNTRKVTGEYIGKSSPDDPLTNANRAAVSGRYRTAGTALWNAAK